MRIGCQLSVVASELEELDEVWQTCPPFRWIDADSAYSICTIYARTSCAQMGLSCFVLSALQQIKRACTSPTLSESARFARHNSLQCMHCCRPWHSSPLSVPLLRYQWPGSTAFCATRDVALWHWGLAFTLCLLHAITPLSGPDNSTRQTGT